MPQSRAYLWKTLRLKRRATARELAAICERPKNSIQVDLRYLRRTGYVVLRGSMYSIVRDTGAKPPMFLFKPGTKNLQGAFDRNSHALFGVDGGEAPNELARRGGRWSARAETKGGRTTQPETRRSRAAYIVKRAVRRGAAA